MLKVAQEWSEQWKTLKNRGIDGFTVGFKPSENPGPIYFDQVCDLCGSLVNRKSWSTAYCICDSCLSLRDRLYYILSSLQQFTKFYETQTPQRP